MLGKAEKQTPSHSESIDCEIPMIRVAMKPAANPSRPLIATVMTSQVPRTVRV
jgi:hypothetical protein